MANTRCLNRLRKELLKMDRDEMKTQGCFIEFDESNIQKACALIIGPKDTIYEGGFFLFDIDVPNDYPMIPPKFTYQTNLQGIRFNANLYTTGKVCLSILNTWSGPGWAPTYNICKCLLSICAQILGVPHPIENEPGFTHQKNKHEAKLYYKAIRYSTLNIATSYYMKPKNLPKRFHVFLPCMEKHFITNFKSSYLSRLNHGLKHCNNGETMDSVPPYNFKCTLNYQNVKKNLVEYHDFLISKKSETKTESILKNLKSENLINKKRKLELESNENENSKKKKT